MDYQPRKHRLAAAPLGAALLLAAVVVRGELGGGAVLSFFRQPLT